MAAIPKGYGIAVIGVIGMALTGVTDMTWHLLFGIEQNLDALFSPTHLLGIVSATLIAIGPLYAMYHRSDSDTWGDKLRLIYAFLLLFVILTIMGEGASFLVFYQGPLTAHPGQDSAQLLAVLLEVFQAFFVAGFALYILRRWRLPFGIFTCSMLAASLVLFIIAHFSLAPLIAGLAGLSIDSAYLLLKPTPERKLAVRLFAIVAAAAEPFFYILLLQLTHGSLAWTIHMAIGSVVVMSKRKVCLIVNPHGGQNLAKLPEILNVLRSGGYEANVFFKEYGGHVLELAEQAARDGCDLLVAYCGDGTLNQVVNGVLRVGGESVVGVLPGGTANLWANEIGVPTDNVLDAASTLLDSQPRRVDVGRVTVRDLFVPSAVLQVQGELLAEEQKQGKSKVKQATRSHFLLMAGLGLDAAVMQGVSKSLKYRIKRLAVGLSAAKELPAYRPFPLEVRADNGDLLWQGDALQVVVGNTR
ncbi:MAG: diacylglycerol/lipid kinase family protein, partial [Ktedonobacteraceae bacterium]